MSLATPLRPFGRKDPPSPLPDPKLPYEAPLKRELAHRVFLICSVSFVATLVTTMSFSAPWFGNLFLAMAMTLVSIVIGTVPPLIVRGRAVSEKYHPIPTRGETLIAFLSASQTWRTLGYFALSGFSLAFLHSHFPILSPTRRNPFRLNERFLYIAFFNASLGLVFAARDIIRQRRIVNWRISVDTTQAPSSRALEVIFASLNSKAITSTTLITAIHIALYPLWYHVIRAFLLPILRNLPWISSVTRPLLHAFGRTWVVDVSWMRMISLGFKTSLGWEIVECGFDYWVTKPITVAHTNEALVAGIHSKERYFKYHAYLELSTLALSSSPAASTRRTALFTDSKTSPTLWSAVVRDVLLTVGHDYQCLIRRDKPAPTPAAAPTISNTPSTSTPKTPRTPLQRTPLIQKPILKPSPRSMFDPLASDGSITETLTAIATLPENVSFPAVFLPSAPSTPKAVKRSIDAVQATTKKIEAEVAPLITGKKPILSTVLAQLPREWGIDDVNVEMQAKACLPEGVLDVLGIDALSHFLAASLKEDTLGMVQRDIPRILEAMSSFLSEAETYRAELESKLPRDETEAAAKRSEVEDVIRAIAVVVPVINALRTGIALVVKTFGERLGVYKFPMVTARRLQGFMDCL